jgi:purine-binding chemotaxis protein CheW
MTTQDDRGQMEFVWRQRAQRLSRRRDSAATMRELVQVIVFQIGAEQYGIELTRVSGVVAPLECSPVPGAPHALAGIIEVQGEIRPVLDLQRMLGFDASGDVQRVILLHNRGGQFGLQVDRVDKIRSIPREELSLAGEGGTAAGLSTKFLAFLTPLMILNTDTLFAELSPEETVS